MPLYHSSLENLITLRRRYHEEPANYMNLWQKLVGSTKNNSIFQEIDFQVEIETNMQIPENYHISRKFQAHFQEDQNSENLIGKSISVTKIEWK